MIAYCVKNLNKSLKIAEKCGKIIMYDIVAKNLQNEELMLKW